MLYKLRLGHDGPARPSKKRSYMELIHDVGTLTGVAAQKAPTAMKFFLSQSSIVVGAFNGQLSAVAE
ncbi:hypothetical protein CDES_09095 [Corynebacterium deserti GIMN1.010]|uniref:Uncharacterized protein n=1 Tax=Corynebacterium deserti GIMN1.010 TaxID=931089 RepID=A0A0M5IM57_9CORY|nr:hypothetical protein CDES_09095 [Corynebacterium deserti GIMN1.010]